MQEKPKRRRRYAFPYFILGLFIAVILIGLLSVLYLVYLKQPITLEGIINLHLTTLLFMYVDIIGLYSALVFGLVGYQKDRAEDARRYADWLSKNQQQEMLKIHEGQTEQDKKHQDEIVHINERMLNEETKFQELETIIRRGKQQWQSTFDSVDDLIVLTDESGAIIRCNRATGEALQLGYSQILGRGIDQLFASDTTSLQGMVPGEKKELKAPNQEVWYQFSKNHLLIDGKQEGWVYIFRNITAQKQALRDQQRLTQYYELMVSNSPVAIATFNHEDRIIDCNPAFEKLFQYSKKEAVGSKVDALVTPEGQTLETRMLAETVRRGEKAQSVTQRRRKDGSLVDVELFLIPVILGGKQVGSMGMYHDVSDLVSYRKVAPVLVEAARREEPEPQVEEIVPEVEAEPAFEEPVMEETPAQGEMEEVQEVVPSIQPKRRLIAIEKIEGIGPVYTQKLAEVGVKTTADLLEQGKSRRARQILVDKTGISHVLLLKWINMSDLFRVRGIGEEYSELLEKAGVDTVKELRNRVPNHLYDALVEANATHKLVRRLPHLSEVENWVKEAKELDIIVTY